MDLRSLWVHTGRMRLRTGFQLQEPGEMVSRVSTMPATPELPLAQHWFVVTNLVQEALSGELTCDQSARSLTLWSQLLPHFQSERYPQIRSQCERSV